MSHEELVEDANEAINKVFGDLTVDQSTTRESLKELADNIDVFLSTL